VSTSGLGFTKTELSDFEVSNPSPKEVMLSEQERKMIHNNASFSRERNMLSCGGESWCLHREDGPASSRVEHHLHIQTDSWASRSV